MTNQWDQFEEPTREKMQQKHTLKGGICTEYSTLISRLARRIACTFHEQYPSTIWRRFMSVRFNDDVFGEEELVRRKLSGSG
jgi:tRNA(Glu) U13 pseudouridine synthase TruD